MKGSLGKEMHVGVEGNSGVGDAYRGGGNSGAGDACRGGGGSGLVTT